MRIASTFWVYVCILVAVAVVGALFGPLAPFFVIAAAFIYQMNENSNKKEADLQREVDRRNVKLDLLKYGIEYEFSLGGRNDTYITRFATDIYPDRIWNYLDDHLVELYKEFKVDENYYDFYNHYKNRRKWEGK